MSVHPARRRTFGASMFAAAVVAAIALFAPSTSSAQPLPRPFDFVSNLDLKCYGITSSSSTLGLKVQLTHLNPVLRAMGLPVETVVVERPEQLCVPVAKNDSVLPPDALRFIEYVDLACYGITQFTPATKAALTLKHLNPVLQHMGLPAEQVVILRPQQLCVPVAKNNRIPPPEIRRLVQYIDLKCYEMTTNDPFNPVPLRLSHLNPVLREMGLPDEDVRIAAPKQLCVPVMKGNVAPPTDVQNIVQWIDLKKYTIDAPQMSPVTLVLTHLNPLLASRPQEKVQLIAAEQLGVPVTKNGQGPPQ